MQIFVDPGYTPDASIPIATGSVSVSVDGAVVNPSLALSPYDGSQLDASATFNYVAPATAGSHLIVATYSGDATHSASSATYSLLVGNVIASGGMSLAAGNLTIKNGGTGSTQITVTPSGGYNGRVVWSLAVTGGSTTSLTACYGINSLTVSNVSTTQLTLGVGTACNSALPSERGAFRPLVRGAGAKAQWSGASSTAVYAGLLVVGLFVGRRRRVRVSLLMVIVMLTVVGAGLTGCGSGSSTSASTATPPPQAASTASYSLTLTGMDSVNTGITASTTFTLAVN
jgi:hypothetical protein